MAIRAVRSIIMAAGLAAGLLMLLVLVRGRSIAVPKFASSYSSSSSSSLSLEDTYRANTDPNLNAKLAHAEKLWAKAVQDRQAMAAEMGPDGEFPDDYISPYHVWDFARPSFFCPHDLERVGTLGDGGKVVCGMTRYERESPGPASETNPSQQLIVYSFGVFGDSSFESDLLRRTNARIWGYDYSVDQWAGDITDEQLPFARFRKMGISNVTDMNRNPPMMSVQDLMKENGHAYVDIIKMDIEGAEFDVLTSLIEWCKERTQDGKATLPFGQLLVEIHFMVWDTEFNKITSLAQWMSWWSALEEMGLRPVNNEDNWIGDNVYGKPRFIEYTLINTADKDRNKLLWG